MCILLIPAHTYAKAITSIRIDDGKLLSSEGTYSEQGITMVPLRMVAEGLGAAVNYDKQTGQIEICKEENSIKATLDSNVVILNNESIVLEVKITTQNGITMVPLRFMSESLNAEVKYHKEYQVICVNANDHNENCIMEKDIVEAYMLAIDTIYKMDPALNDENKYLAIDTSKMNYLSEPARQELLNRLDEYNLTVIEANYEALDALGLIDNNTFTEGILIKIDDIESNENKVILSIEKFKSSMGAVGCPEIIIEEIEGEWEITARNGWYMS